MLGINPMGRSETRINSIEIIVLHPVNVLTGIKPTGLSYPWSDSIGIIYFNTVEKY